MSNEFEIITFDCYGTLIDWEAGIASAFLDAARPDGLFLDRQRVLDAYAQFELQVEHEAFRPYRDVLGITARRVADALGWDLAPGKERFLADSLSQWRPFADTNPALERLRDSGHRLGILSNVDEDLLAATRDHFTVAFDLIITAQQVHSYKPAPGHFLAARERIGEARWLHAAQSNVHDIIPANTLGISHVWINRKQEQALPGGTPGRELGNMAELADWLATA